MKRRKLSASIASIMAAAMIVSAGVTHAQSVFDVSPTALLQQVQASVQAGDFQNALALIARLRAMGVTSITVDGSVIELAVLEDLIVQGSPEAVQIIVAAVAAAEAGVAAFNFDSAVVVSTRPIQDNFPTSSAG